jgi:Fe-S-cluster containining protein
MNLEQIYKQIPEAKCRANCGQCCGILFPALSEIRNIKKWCFVHHVEYRDFTMEPDADCPYLTTEKKCAIYPVRPFLCRILGATTDKRMTCPGCNCPKPLNPIEAGHLFNLFYGGRKERGREAKHQRELEKIFAGLVPPGDHASET